MHGLQHSTNVTRVLGLRNDWAKAFVQRISRGMPSRKNTAIVALARKLLVTLWAMLRDNARWREPKIPFPQTTPSAAA
jgi:hypothetical protein